MVRCIRFIKLVMILSVLVHFFNACNQNAEPETYIISEGFVGKVNIIFNRKEGASPKYEGGRRVYEIPRDGVLISQFKINDGFINRNYYYKMKSGELRLLKKFDNDSIHSRDRDEIGIFLDGISGVYGNSGVSSALQYQEFIVSSYNLIDSFFTPAYVRKFNEKIEKISALKLN